MLLERTPPRRDQQRSIPTSASGSNNVADSAGAAFQWTPLGSSAKTSNNNEQVKPSHIPSSVSRSNVPSSALKAHIPSSALKAHIPSSASRSHIPSSISRSRIAKPANGSTLPRSTTTLLKPFDETTPRAFKNTIKKPAPTAQDDEFERKLMAAMAQADAGGNPFLDKRKAMMRGDSQDQDDTLTNKVQENPFYDSGSSVVSIEEKITAAKGPRVSRSLPQSPRLSTSRTTEEVERTPRDQSLPQSPRVSTARANSTTEEVEPTPRKEPRTSSTSRQPSLPLNEEKLAQISRRASEEMRNIANSPSVHTEDKSVRRRSSGSNLALIQAAHKELEQVRERNEQLEDELIALKREVKDVQQETVRQEAEYKQRLKQVEASMKMKRSQELNEWTIEKKLLNKEIEALQQQQQQQSLPIVSNPVQNSKALFQVYESESQYYDQLQSSYTTSKSLQLEILALKREKSQLRLQTSAQELEAERYKHLASIRRESILGLKEQVKHLTKELESAQKSQVDENVLKETREELNTLKKTLKENEKVISDLQKSNTAQKKSDAKEIDQLRSQAKKDEDTIVELKQQLSQREVHPATTVGAKKRIQPSALQPQPRKRPAYQNLREVSGSDDDEQGSDDEESVSEEEVIPKPRARSKAVTTGSSNSKRPRTQAKQKEQEDVDDDEEGSGSESEEEQVQSLVISKPPSRTTKESIPAKGGTTSRKPSSSSTKPPSTTATSTVETDDIMIKPSTSSSSSSSKPLPSSQPAQKKKKRRLLGMQSSNPFSSDIGSDPIIPSSTIGEDVNVEKVLNPDLGVPLSLSPVKGAGAVKQSRLNFGRLGAGGKSVPRLF